MTDPLKGLYRTDVYSRNSIYSMNQCQCSATFQNVHKGKQRIRFLLKQTNRPFYRSVQCICNVHHVYNILI